MAKYLVYRGLGKGAIGTVLLTIGLLLGWAGLAGLDEEDGKVKLKVGDYRVDISRLWGTSSIAAGIMASQTGKLGTWDTIFNVGNIWSEGFILKDLMETSNYSAGGFTGWLSSSLSNFPSSFIPNIWRHLTSLTHQTKYKYSSGFQGSWERLMVGLLPSFIYSAPKRTDIWTGEELSKSSVPVLTEITRILGIQTTMYNPTDAQRFAAENNIGRRELDGKYVEGTVNKDILNTAYGTYNQTRLNAFMQNKTAYEVDGRKMYFRNMTNEQQITVFNRIITQNQQYAKIYTFTQTMGYKYYTGSAELQRLRELGIVKNVYLGDKGLVQ
jgi:hypothetical protein